MLGVVASGMGQANQNIPVVDASPGVSRQANVSVAQGGVSAGAQAAQLFYQVELLQQEVQELRGIVEQQAYQVNRMREEQRDRYLDLDRRITLLNQATSKSTSVQPAKPVVNPQTSAQPSIAPVTQPKPATVTPASTAAVVDKAGEKKAYQAAFALVRNKQYAKAGSAFEQLIQQRDRYLDLDRRITLLNQATSKSTSVQPAKPVVNPQTSAQPSIAPVTQPKPATVTPASTAAVVDKAGEKKAYQAAFALVRNKQYAKAGSAFEQLIKDYPDGNYTGNAYYWLGEVLLVESDYEQALKAFGSLLGNYPGHRKAADAKYKQGKIYLQLGENARAKQLLQDVVDQHAGTSAAKLAEAEMRDAQL